jgi:hypothetical protein
MRFLQVVIQGVDGAFDKFTDDWLVKNAVRAIFWAVGSHLAMHMAADSSACSP